MPKPLSEKRPTLSKTLKEKLNPHLKQVKIEFKGFIPATNILLKKEDFEEIIRYFEDEHSWDSYYIIEDKLALESPDGEIINIDHGWGTNIYACLGETMMEVPEDKRTSQNDWWHYPAKEEANRKQGIKDEDNQCYKGQVKCPAAPNNALDLWAALRQISEMEYGVPTIFIGIPQFQWGRKIGDKKYENYTSKSEADAAFNKDPSKGQFYERHSMNLTDFIQ